MLLELLRELLSGFVALSPTYSEQHLGKSSFFIKKISLTLKEGCLEDKLE